ncbi:hypothetical protein GALMADRAFT_267450 [Galerina marginata CBS 339.88]|uniref:Yeast cell wall synthesis Kre9/Knh1-like N-terminal domain-containing protein n=1 Tax=Galerina marginata (strain CBS 339.88) TaxID=685588 RepID=A0A067T4M0_GALM3|nr:hypothetical protein GALMADRAFT_267450 [Galerina marginata CBS 339.88]
MFSQALVVFAFASAAMATVFVTAPVASTSYAAGQKSTIQWQDSGAAPSLADFGPAKISIYAGNAQQQTLLQTLDANTDVSKVSSLDFTPDPTIGPNSSEYFIRFESLSLKDSAQPQFPALAFSAKFTLTGMTGVFSAAVLSQISGQSTAPLASQSAPAGVSTPAPASTTSSPSSATSKKASSTGPTPSATKASGAMGVRAGWAGVVLGAVVGITVL